LLDSIHFIKKIQLKYIIAFITFLAALGFWVAYQNDFSFSSNAPEKYTDLMQMGDRCVGISENAASKLVAVVEYQKLEIAGRKSRVLLNCMNDNGYFENPAWTSYATPIAKDTANKTGVSFNEAIENMRRASMLVFKTKKDEPIFWVQAKASTTQ